MIRAAGEVWDKGLLQSLLKTLQTGSLAQGMLGETDKCASEDTAVAKFELAAISMRALACGKRGGANTSSSGK